MPKNSTGNKNPSRIRFVMVEAELGDGDIGQITQAITNALRGPTPTTVVRRITAPAPIVNGGAEQAEPETVEEAVEEVEAVDVTPQAPRQKTPRKPAPKPNPIDIDVTTDPSLALCVGKTNPKSQHKRYLAIAAWLHDYRGIETITADHIYTCYRLLGWPTNIPDFAQPLRELKHDQYFTSQERGKYSINQLGLAKAAEAIGGE
jgi:hypothetical protein